MINPFTNMCHEAYILVGTRQQATENVTTKCYVYDGAVTQTEHSDKTCVHLLEGHVLQRGEQARPV